MLSRKLQYLSAVALSSIAVGCGQGAGASSATSGGGSGSVTASGAGGTSSVTPSAGSGGDGTSPPIVMVTDGNVVSDMPLSPNQPGLPAVTHPRAPGAFFAGHTAPLPTNAFWENMAVDKGDMLTNAFPYHVFAQSDGLALSRPDTLSTADKYCFESAPTQLVLSAAEGFTGHSGASWDPLSITVQYQAAGGTMKTPVVYGMAYATALYEGLTPKLTSPIGVSGINGTVSGGGTGRRFDIALKNGQHWILYTSESVTVNLTNGAVVFAAPLHGWARVALQTAQITAQILDQYASAIPLGASLRLSTQGDTGIVEFGWKKQGTGDLLSFGLPHHLEHLATPNLVTPPITTVRGAMRGVVGDTWQLQYPLSPVLRAAPHAIDPAHHDAIVAALEADKGIQLDAGDSYNFGKQVGRAAELLLIAEALGQTATADQLRQAIEGPLEDWLDGKGPDAFRYDQTYGGIVTSKGIGNSGADFGNGWYNDHHFHYGYFIFAAGAVAKGDPNFASKYRDEVLNLIRDIANPSAADPYFTQFRMFDWFDGHSWASGLFPFQDGRNQESSSEAFNAWAGISLFGDATGDQNLLKLGRIMRAVEAASVQRYYHIRKNSDIYPSPFRERMVTGVLWSDKAEYGTFFSNGDAQIFGIQVLPTTIASEELIDAAWVQDAWPAMQAAGGSDEWRGLLTMAHAVTDSASAWTEVNGMTKIEGGNSKTNMLYWVATRP